MTEEEKHKQLLLVGEQVNKTIRYTFPNSRGVIIMMGFIDENHAAHNIFIEDSTSWPEACRIAVGCIGQLDQHYLYPGQSDSLD